MILILCNHFSEYADYLNKLRDMGQDTEEFIYACGSLHVNQTISIELKEIRIITPVTWFTFQEYFELIRRLRG